MAKLPNTFEIGLVSAGAVSGGAYTSGAMDFLIEALDAWYQAKSDDPSSVPGHDVLIRAMAGASAGSICSAIGTVALARDFPPVRERDQSGAAINPFYNSWVNAIDIADLLTIDDLAGSAPPLRSLLNSSKLSSIVDGVLSQGLPAKGRAYLAQQIAVRFTVGNLRGVPHVIHAKGAKGADHGMMKHSDYMGFVASYPAGRPTTYHPREEYALVPDASAGDPGWALLGQSALGSGAFPLFLQPRLLRHADYPDEYARRLVSVVGEKCEDAVGSCYRVKPVSNRPEPIAGSPPYDFLVVDGGVFDNEPLELARTALAGPLEHNPRSGIEAFRAVLMIDPFLETLNADLIPENEPLWKLVGHLLTAWKMNSRFDADELALSNAEENYSRYLLSPSRGTSDPIGPSHPLAAGGLSGFLGFFDRAYRHHDYMLGRRNMQRLLQIHFSLPAANPVFAGKWTQDQIDFWGVTDDQGVLHLPIVPLVPRLHPVNEQFQEPLPAWPAGRLDLAEVMARIETRLDKVVAIMLRDSGFTGFVGFLARQVWGFAVRSKVLDKIEETLKDTLRAQKLD